MIKPRNLAMLMQRTADLISTSAFDPSRRVCFVSYDSADYSEVEQFILQFGREFVPRCTGVTDQGRLGRGPDEGFLLSQVRAQHLGDSTVTILLVGRETWHRKFVDWEIAASLGGGHMNPRSGILVLPLPSTGNRVILPERISDNYNSDDPDGSYVVFAGYPSAPGVLRTLIERAHAVRSEEWRQVDNSRGLRRSDTP